MVKFDLSIPGYCTLKQLNFISKMASQVPERGQILEVGSLFGRSAFCWQKSSHESVKVFCIDPWDGLDAVAYTGEAMKDGHAVTLPNTIEQFKRTFTERNQPVPQTFKETSPLNRPWNQGALDVVYLDGGHDYKSVHLDIGYWLNYLKPDGVICGDDFTLEFTGVMRAVLDSSERHGFKVRRYLRMWILETELNRHKLRNLEELNYET